jgi:hypothetical protein
MVSIDMVERNSEHQHGKTLLEKPASQRGEYIARTKEKKSKEMPIDGK